MINHPQMEIKVALLGNVSAGKTTVLNALIQNKYGEVAKKWTTSGANYFYLNVIP
jgi:GTPase SAR1 family protein